MIYKHGQLYILLVMKSQNNGIKYTLLKGKSLYTMHIDFMEIVLTLVL